jgi:hypothetical protein
MINKKYNFLIYDCGLPNFNLNELNQPNYISSTNNAYKKIKKIWTESPTGGMYFWKPGKPSSFSFLESDKLYWVASNTHPLNLLPGVFTNNTNLIKTSLPEELPEIGDYILFLGTSEDVKIANSTQTVITQISIVRSPQPILEIILSKQINIQSNINIEFYSPYHIPSLVHPTNYCLGGS